MSTTSLINATASQMKQQEQQQQHYSAQEAFSTQTKYFRDGIIPRYKDETCSADIIDKSSLCIYNNHYQFVLTVIDILTENA